MQIVNSDGKPLEEDDIVAPSNLFLHSLFNKVEVKLNGRQVCSMNNYICSIRQTSQCSWRSLLSVTWLSG